MAQQGHQLERDRFSCSICLDLLKDPVSIPCGHSYCRCCIEGHWDKEDVQKIYFCPQCRQEYPLRPVLAKNIILADLVEELKKTGPQGSPAEHCYAEAEDVACDVCTGKKLKALKSCLVCLASYCEDHLQPHYQSPPFKTHTLVEPSKNLQDNICSRHNEVKKMFCLTDQQCICHICPVDEHKGHNFVSAAAERAQRQKELELSLQEIHQRVQDREKDAKVLHQQMDALSVSADKAGEDNERIYTEMISLLEKRRSDEKQQIRSQQQHEVSGVEELLEKVQQEINDLKKKDTELKQLSNTQDDNQFLMTWHSLSALSPSTRSSAVNVRSVGYFEDVTAAASQLKATLQDLLLDPLNERWTNATVTRADVLMPRPEPKHRAEFLKYSQQITLDPETARKRLSLSEGNRKITLMDTDQSYSSHPDRFSYYAQVLSKESLPDRCYWEVKRKGDAIIAVSYKNISRAGNSDECRFGHNNRSWAIHCDEDSYDFYYNNVCTELYGPSPTSRVGVFLDHSAGLLSFYNISHIMTLIHRVQTTFSQPLYAGVGLFWGCTGDSAEVCKLK